MSIGHSWLLVALMIWSIISWLISQAVQSYLLSHDPASGSAGMALNTSAMHRGVALGAALGSAVISLAGIAWAHWVGVSLVAAAVLCAAPSCWFGREPETAAFSAPSR